MQNSLFDFPHYSISKPIRLIELFGGIGSQAMALRDIGANFEHYRLVEFDKYAVATYNAIHGTDFKVTDICDVHGKDLGIVDKDNYCYLLTYSFPCTDLSVAGNMNGMSRAQWEEGKSTRSGLLWEVERILSELHDNDLPQVLVMENVPQVHAEANKPDFDLWLAYLRGRGYQNFWQDLNAKDYGVPQNRDRCFCVSILSEDFIDYEFPNPIPLETVMKDYLESTVDEKYYINNDKARKLIEQLLKDGVIGNETVKTNGKDIVEKTDIATTLSARDSKGFSESFQCMNGVVESEAINTMPDGTCRTLKSQYAKNSVANFENQGTYGATGVIEQRTENREQRTENREQRTENREQRTENSCTQLICVSRTQEKFQSQTASRQGTTAESQTCKQTEAVYLNYRRIDKTGCKVAKTLCARDYKGFGTGFDTMNGVIEWENKKD